MCGTNVRIIEKTSRSVDIQGIDNHQITDVTSGAVVYTQRGPIIIILNQYAYIGHRQTNYSSGQLESFNCDVNDKSMKVKGGSQRIINQEGFAVPIDIISGLQYINVKPYTDKEWKTLPHVILASDVIWDPTILDNVISDDYKWFDVVSDHVEDVSPLFDIYEEYNQRH